MDKKAEMISRLREARGQVAEMAHMLDAAGSPGAATTLREVVYDLDKVLEGLDV